MSKYDQGFTLVELMMTVAVLAILLSVGVPSMGEFVRPRGWSRRPTILSHSFHLARTEAIKRGARVTLCKSLAGATCGCAALLMDAGESAGSRLSIQPTLELWMLAKP